jgi:beta-mannosidase
MVTSINLYIMMITKHIVGLVFFLNFILSESFATDTLTLPKWQTVVPDTGVVVELTGGDDSSSPPWQLHSGDRKYAVSKGLGLPSDLLTNLLHAGIIQDPYLDRNFLTQRHVWMGDHAVNDQLHTNRTRSWIYTTSFELPAPELSSTPWTWYLVVEGIKMGANIEVNGVHLGTVTNQFLRYEFQLLETHLFHTSSDSSQLRGDPTTSKHNLTITFDPSIAVDGRFSACSGGWDWAPYTKSDDAQGKRSYTLGIVKPIYLVAVQDVAIHHVVPKIYYRGPYPRTPMVHPAGDFELQLNVHLNVVRSTGMYSKEIVVRTPQHQLSLSLSSDTVCTGENIVTANVTFPGEDIDLWWPNGFGSQPLYNIFVGFGREDRGIAADQQRGMLQKRIGECCH